MTSQYPTAVAGRAGRTHLWLKPLFALSMAVSSQLALAQEQSGVAALMEEVLVTAQKKSTAEDAQDVPIAVTGYSGAKIEAMFAVNLVDVGRSAPNVNLSPQGTVPGVANFIIRGMGTAGQSIPSSDPAVGVVVDGVPFGTIYGVVTDLFDMESVEVLRGPQGTLFGRNVTGGAVVLRTTRPSDEFKGKVKLAVGSHELKEASLLLSGPFSDNFGGKIAVLAKDRDGYYPNDVLGGRQGKTESLVVRPTLAYTGETFDATLFAEYGNVEGDGPSARNFYLFGVWRDPYADHSTIQTEKGRSDLEWSSVSLETNVDLWGGKVTGIVGYRELEQDSWGDVDGAPNTVRFEFGDGSGLEQDQQSLEVRWAGNVTDRLSLTAGVNVFDQEYVYRERRLLVDAVDRKAKSTIEHSTTGIFAQGDYQLSDTWTLTVGGRYSTEDKDASIGVIGDPGAVGDCATTGTNPRRPRTEMNDCRSVFTDSESWSNFSPKVGLKVDLSDDAMAYFTYSRGFRSGGYNTRFADPSIVTANPLSTPGPYDEEVVDAYEVGAKTEWLDGRARVNGAIFYNKYDDLQRSANNQSGVQTIFNAATATMTGFELDAVVLITDNLAFEAAYGYVSASYDEARYLEVARGRPASTFVLQMVPDKTYSASLTYSHALGALGNLTWRGSYSYTGQTFADDFNFLPLREYDLVDASVSFTNAKENLKISAYGRNLTDKVYFAFGFDNTAIGSRTMWLSPPRTYGLELTYDF